MEGSIAGRIQIQRPPQLPARERSVRPRRTLRLQAEKSAPLQQLVTTVWRRKWFLLGMALLGGALAGLAGLSRPQLYEAASQVILEQPEGNAVTGAAASADALASRVDDHITVLLSQANLRLVLAAVRDADLAKQAEGDAAVQPAPEPGFLERMKSAVGGFLGKLWPRDAEADSPDAVELKILSKGVRIGQELRSRVITIGFTDDDPVYAAKLANIFAQVYIDSLLQKQRAYSQQELDSIVERLPAVRDELLKVTDQLETYRLTHGTADPGTTDGNAKDVAELNRQISLSTAGLASAQGRLQRIETLQSQDASLAAIAEAIGSPVLTELVTRQQNGDADGDLPAAINKEIEQSIAQLEASVHVYRGQIASLKERKSGLDAAAADAASRLSGLRALEPPVAMASQQYNALLARQQELIQRIASPEVGVKLLSAAWPPAIPKTLSPIFLIPPGMILFGVLAALYVVIRSHFDTTVRGEVEAEEALGIPCLGLLPKFPKMQPTALRRELLERPGKTYSRAVLSLLFGVSSTNEEGRPAGVVLVTSGVEEDGKVALAWSLAMSASRLGGRVLVIDLDPKDAPITNGFRDSFSAFTSSNSFTDYVSGRCSLHDAVEDMPEIGIDFMPAPSRALELLPLLSSVDDPHFVSHLRSNYGFVVIIGPSAQEGPEAMLLTRWADCVLFAVRWGKTKRDLARSVLAQLGPDGSPPPHASSVLTDVNLKQHASYHFKDSGELLLASSR